MPYDQSWMGYGFVGGVEAGAISAAVGALLFVLFHAIGRRYGWSDLRKIGWSYLLALIVSGGADGAVITWDPRTGLSTRRPFQLPGRVEALAMTRGGDMIVGFGFDLAVLQHV